MLKARRHVQNKNTRGKFFHGSRCQIAEEKSVARIVCKECFKGLVESNMEPALGQRCKDETCNVMKHDMTRPLLCKCLRARIR
jgi:hypothetical protein